MVIFVTGGSGFLGTQFLNQLLQQLKKEDIVRVLVRSKFQGFDNRIQQIVGDLLSPETWLPALRDVNYIFHLGGDPRFGNGEHYYNLNVRPVEQMMDALKNNKNLIKIIYTSTIGVLDRRPTDLLVSPLTEKACPCPTSDYGKSKLKAEDIIKKSGLSYTILRIGWVYGPGMRSNSHLKVMASTIYRFPMLARFNFPGIAPLIHVEDVAKALCNCIHPQKSKNKTYIAVTENASFGDIARLLFESYFGALGMQFSIPGLSKVTGYIHSLIPFNAKILFGEYLKAEDNKFKNELLPLYPKKFKDNYKDILKSSQKVEWCIVTGANSGIGNEITRQLIAQGCSVVGVDMCTNNLINSKSLIVIKSDLSKEAEIENLAAQLKPLKIKVIINNAGVGFKGKFSDSSKEKIQQTIDTNIYAPLRLTHLLLNKLKNDNSVIVNIASSVAYNPLPGMATYAASKAFLLNWSLALGEELKATNKVITFSPAGTKTNFQNSAGVKNVDSPSLFDAETVADAIIQAIKKKKYHTIMGIKTNLFILLIRLIPHKYRLAVLSQIFEKNR